MADTPDPAPTPCAPALFTPFSFAPNEGTNVSPLPLAAGGSLRAVMLFVDFADRRASESPGRLYDSLVPKARSWFAETSYGRASLDVTGLTRWLRLPQTARAYGVTGGLDFEEQHGLIAAAVSAADASVDFTAFQLVYVVAAQGSGVVRSQAFHAFDGDGIAVDGVELRYGSMLGDDVRGADGAHVLVHETGHVLGLPDLYDTAHPVYPSLFRYAGGWDPMSWPGRGAHFLAWHKWKLGWLDASDVTCLHASGTLTATLTPLARRGGLKTIVVPTGPSTALVVEARRRLGHDAGLCEQGVLVYSVDATIATGLGPLRVRPAQRDRTGGRVHDCGLLSEAPFDRGAGETARFSDSPTGVTMDVLGSSPAGYRVRVTRAEH